MLVYADALSESVTRGFAGCACVKGDIKSRRSAVISMTLISGTTIFGCIDLTRIQGLSKLINIRRGSGLYLFGDREGRPYINRTSVAAFSVDVGF